MLTPIVCMTCGCPVGDKAGAFRHMRAKKVKAALAERGTAAERASADAGLRIECADILDSLRVGPDCCRKTLVTAMVFTDLY
jgi:DNA-directed RNA polymerase subunit N (RpoN/RPB10)